MHKILLLGGTKEAVWLAEKLALVAHVTYSLAGKTLTPALPQGCTIRTGGFGGVSGLVQHLKSHDYSVVIDATHPFAVQISRHVKAACVEARTMLCIYERPFWQPKAGDHWQYIADKQALRTLLDERSRHALVTLGQRGLEFFRDLRRTILWLRMITPPEAPHFLLDATCRHTILTKRPPYGFDFESDLINKYQLDCLVTRNSGGVRPAKLDAAAKFGLPVFMLGHPPPVDQGTDLQDFLAEIYTRL